MKFKIDENLPVDIAEILKSFDHDAVTVIEQGLRSARDNTIINVCLEEERILITLDLDFADVCTYPPKQYAGIIVIRVNIQEKYHIINTFKRVIPLIERGEIKQRLWIVEEWRVRIRE